MNFSASGVSYEAPSIAYGALSPMLIVLGAAVVGVLLEAVIPRAQRFRVQLALALVAIVAAFAALIAVASAKSGGVTTVAGAVVLDRPAMFLQGTVLLVSLVAVAFMGERRLERVVRQPELVGAASGSGPGGSGPGDITDADMFTPSGASVPGSDAEYEATRAGGVTTEVFPLALFAVGGMMLFGACGDLLTMFVALEVMSLPLYLLCGLARRRRLISQEAALKYFLLGAFASAFFLFGAAFAYGATGTLDLTGINASVIESDDRSLAVIGFALVAVGLLFKVGAVPFHSWVPDVYQGAPTPITGFMAAATKVAAFGGLLRVCYLGFGGIHDDWKPILWVVAIATMLVGAVMAVTQSDIKRMLAYSSITHAGFLLLGVIALDEHGVSATLFYLAVYGFSTLGAFATISVVREPDRPVGPHLSGREATDISQWAGLGKRYPLVGAMFSMFLLAFAGIPLTSGFIAKFAVFSAAAGSGAGVLVVIGVLSSAIAAYFYIRIIIAMFFTDPPDDPPHIVRPSILTTAGIAVCTAVTIILGILPQPLLDLAERAAEFTTLS
ncbi:NADH-quinone oxidoreductase subunit NuoN [Gordonia amarae]|uniref:NADH-quinone oxidoreductase subunit N n=2 Tax=Gordonia amarae TaxID=36821 RepID=G7GM58_9ACTN|nr:NADH-quinone oxidoreductase subunit NuoN [Gordonia amarae]MCS3876386.1 NADH-quinone oxidoreductase subunit N [Gordonia amarae]QHN19306.1 NADH-quinone oxidoreductase subunit NuoN [Gordonia amarae]QHN23782.1 NADH-quinone oxidoreductase subunit NuoN [Gordonia amarae]QHN32694.1 NADH-quinone oxidoreductase subunit NuoN [Gordonia amarae]QHN41442.1 NADH-quinone oxidoreductase subunit NuoN [Gordonia amarae]